MASKLEAARQATGSGENVIIASGRKPEPSTRSSKGARWVPHSSPKDKRWQHVNAGLATPYSPAVGSIIDQGARQAVEFNGSSLLAIGILKVSGHFDKGDVVAVCDEDGQEFARGLSNYSSDDIRRIRGLKTAEITGVLGHCPYEKSSTETICWSP